MNDVSGLVIVVSIMAGVFAMVLGLALMRFVKRSVDDEVFQEKLADAKRSEFYAEEDEKDKASGWMDWWDRLYRQTGRTGGDETTAGKLALGIIVVGGLFGFLVWPRMVVGGVLFAALGAFVLYAVFNSEKNKRSKTLDGQLPLMLSTLRAHLQSNATPQQAIIETASEVPAPLGDELKTVVADINLNVPLEDALNALADRVKSREIKFLVSSIQIAVNSGTDLDPQIATIQEIVVQRQRIRNKLAAAVAQVQPALWVSGVIIPGGFLFSYISSEANRDFWHSFFGFAALGVVAFLYAAGLLITRKLIKGVENT